MTQIAEKRRMQKQARTDALEIMLGLRRTNDDLHSARCDFNMAVEPELVEACVYRINALQSQYSYYLRMAKELNLELDYGALCARKKQEYKAQFTR
jgi:hypothetical protein